MSRGAQKTARVSGRLRSFDMGVVADMVFAIAMVAIAAGAVAELQIEELRIGAAADGAAVGIGCLGLGNGGFVGASPGSRGIAGSELPPLPNIPHCCLP